MITGMADRLKDLRIKKGLSQKQAGELVGVAPNTISSYEQNSCSPQADVLMKLASIYSTSTDYILGVSYEHPIDLSHLTLTQRKRLCEFIRRLINYLVQDEKS